MVDWARSRLVRISSSELTTSCLVTNGAVEIFFNDQKIVAAEYPKLAATIGASLTLYMEVNNLQDVLDRVKKAGAKISMLVTEQFYGMKEFAFDDQDGYTITIAEKM